VRPPQPGELVVEAVGWQDTDEARRYGHRPRRDRHLHCGKGMKMAITLDDKVSLRTAYLIMYTFATRYWHRGKQADVMTDFIVDIGPVRDEQTADPAQIHHWTAAAAFVLSHPECSWADFGKVLDSWPEG
jgi:hypothetical protein